MLAVLAALCKSLCLFAENGVDDRRVLSLDPLSPMLELAKHFASRQDLLDSRCDPLPAS